jgi:uridine kinase
VAALAARVRDAEPRLGLVRLVAVDGPAGSGKTTLAGLLAEGARAAGLDAATVHLDDLYEGWTGLDGVWERLDRWVLRPLAQGRPGRYRRYDWSSGAWAEWHDVPLPEVLVVEGCGAAQRAVDDHAVLRVWLEAGADARLARGLARDGEGHREDWLSWMVAEEAHFAREHTRDRADVRYTT